MLRRTWIASMVVIWLAAMSWLAVEKILPSMLGGEPPKHETGAVCWRIVWDGKPLGVASTTPQRAEDGSLTVHNVVHLDEFPLKQLVGHFFGVFAKNVEGMFEGLAVEKPMHLESVLRFHPDGGLKTLHTSLDLAGMENAVAVDGRMIGPNRLELTVAPGDPELRSAVEQSLFRQEIDLPRDALVADAFTPHARMKDLRIGQAWTMPVVRPFPPGGGTRMISAIVARHELLFWDNQTVETLVVEYREDASDGVGGDGGPIGQSWVRRDGVVLQQEMDVAGLKVGFIRIPKSKYDDEPHCPHAAK